MRLIICAALLATFGVAAAQEMEMTSPAELKQFQFSDSTNEIPRFFSSSTTTVPGTASS